MTPVKFLLVPLAIAALGTFIPTPTTAKQATRRWELDAFLAEHFPPAMQDVTERLDPLTGFKEIFLNLTFPSYLKLQGSITDVKFEGISSIQLNYSTSAYVELAGSGYFYIHTYFPTTVFSARHNISGTIHSKGIDYPVGGGWRNLTLVTVPARSSYMFDWSVNEERHVVMDGPARYPVIEIQPNNGTNNGVGWWDIDYNGLLDPISFDPDLKENAIYWITRSVLKGNDHLWDDVVTRMIEPFVEALNNAFADATIDEILANPPSTTRSPINPLQ